MENVLITGGAGFIGLHLARYLLKQGQRITLIDDLSRGKKDRELAIILADNRVKFINADLTRIESFSLLERSYECVYHLAAINGTANFYRRPAEVLRVNILSLLNLLEWLTPDKSGKFLFSSSSETYAGTIKSFSHIFKDSTLYPTGEDIPLTIDDIFNERNSYACSKITGELLTINYCRKKGIPFIIIRYHNIYGPRMGYEHVIPQFCQKVIEKENPFIINGTGAARSFCYVKDAVRATALVRENTSCNNQVINIGNDREEIRIYSLAERIMDITGYTAPVEAKPAPPGSVMRRCPDLEKIKQLTSYQPEIELDEGLKKTFAWYLHNYQDNSS